MNGESTVVVIPTYNERENLKELVERIVALKIPNLRLVVVDDNSPDGTGKLADELANTYPLRVIHRPYKLGLGKAYTAAFEDILRREKPDYVIQMDADFSHDPTAIPQFLREIKKYDIVLGSRYAPGGTIKNWNRARKWISRFGNAYARIVLNLPYHDLTGGYKCYKKRVLETTDLTSLSSVGYNFQIETTYKAHKNGYRISEIPITFTERKEGASKFDLPIIIESFIKVLLLRFHA
ncbi:MAG TPA: polyprenol monophosphomannose synthase [Candidatus Paceibacterota bacterium]